MWAKVVLILIVLLFWIAPISVTIPFIYENKYFIVLTFSYILLAILFFSYVVFGDHSVYQKQSRNERIAAFSAWGAGPLIIGFCLSLLTPITADLLASEFAMHEYKAVKTEQYAKTFSSLSTLHVVDVKNNEASFVIKNEMLNQLNLHTGDKLVVRGRNCIAGFEK